MGGNFLKEEVSGGGRVKDEDKIAAGTPARVK